MKYKLEKMTQFSAAEGRKLGISSRMLAYYCEQGWIERVCRGVYRGSKSDSGLDTSLEELVLTAMTIPKGVVCLISALCFYKLTDQLMRSYWIAIPNADRSPLRPHTRIVRMRNMTLGVTSVKLGQFEMKIFDRERTVIDCFRYLSDEIAIKALKEYLKSSPDLIKLAKYAKILRVKITPYIMALTT